MPNIEKVHEEVFNVLNAWSEQSRTRGGEINPYFYMRSVRDDRFKRGYWFPGNENYLCISFWNGGDSSNKTPNIYFEINFKTGCTLVIVAKDSDAKYNYFSQIVKELDVANNTSYIERDRVWTKPLSKYWERWDKLLKIFLENDKAKIDSFLSANEIVDIEEYVSRFGFISAGEFDSMHSRVMKERSIIKESQKTVESEYDRVLPFSLLGINIENYQGVINTGLKEIRPDAQWIYITGENGYGKTTILQAIALGASDDPELEKYLDEKSRISLTLNHNNEKAFPIRTKGALGKNESSDFSKLVIGYGPARLISQSVTSENAETRGRNNVMSLFEAETKLKSIQYELFASNYVNTEVFEELQDVIRLATKGRITEVQVIERNVLFREALANGDVLDPMPLNKLAAGYRSIINIVIDIYLRLKSVHLDRKYKEFYGIVLLDEIENHLHPILQKELPIALSEVFPNIQFIISTHSPVPLLAAEKSSVILKINRTKEDGVTIELVEIDNVKSLTPNILFTSPVFGFSDIFNANLENGLDLRTEDTWEDMNNSINVDKKLLDLYNQRKSNL